MCPCLPRLFFRRNKRTRKRDYIHKGRNGGKEYATGGGKSRRDVWKVRWEFLPSMDGGISIMECNIYMLAYYQ